MPKEEESVDEEEIDEDWDFDIIDNKKETKEEKAVKPKKNKAKNKRNITRRRKIKFRNRR